MSIFCKHIYKQVNCEYAYTQTNYGSAIIPEPSVEEDVWVVTYRCLLCDKIKAKKIIVQQRN